MPGKEIKFRKDERLFVGRFINDKWYNYFKVNKPDRILDVLNTKEDSFISLAYNFMRKCVTTIYTENGEAYELRCDESVNDYNEFVYEDLQAIAWRAMKLFNNDNYSFDEYFYCELCTRGRRNPQYHKINKSWHNLWEKGDIVINYLKDHKGSKWSVKLKTPIEIEGNKHDTIHFSFPTFGQMSDMHDAIRDGELISEVDQKYAYTDLSIKSIDGLEPGKLTTYKRKNGLGAFSRGYFKTDEDWELIDNSIPDVGFDPEVRHEKGKCGAKLIGMDFANFFYFLGYKKKDQNKEK